VVWTDTLRQASFRGVTFSVEGHELEGGKRVVPHRFPFRPKAVVEDLGQVEDQYEINAFLVGDDYPTRRDRLLAALAEDGAGELVHPYHGTKRVVAARWRLVERSSERRVCRILMTFVEASELTSPVAIADPAASTRVDAEILRDVAGDAFEDDLLATLKPNAAKEGAAFGTGLACTDLLAWDLFGLPAKAAAWTRDVLELADTALALLSSPGQFVGTLQGIFLDMQAAVGSRLVLLELLFGLCEREAHRDRPFLTEGASADDGADAIAALLARMAAAEAAKVATSITWGSYEEATAARDRLVRLVDELAEDAPDDVYAALATLQATVTESLPPPESDLPRITTITLPRARPALVVAYALYDDVDRADEIVERNHAPNPCALPSGVPLQVLVGEA